MDIVLMIEILTAVLSVIGIVCVAKYISDTFFLPREIITAVTILDNTSRENADVLLQILKKGLWRGANRNISVIIDKSFSEDSELMEMIESACVEYYFVEINKKGG